MTGEVVQNIQSCDHISYNSLPPPPHLNPHASVCGPQRICTRTRWHSFWRRFSTKIWTRTSRTALWSWCVTRSAAGSGPAPPAGRPSWSPSWPNCQTRPTWAATDRYTGSQTDTEGYRQVQGGHSQPHRGHRDRQRGRTAFVFMDAKCYHTLKL